MSRKALLIVDVQNDFCPGGALAVPNGDKVVGPLNAMLCNDTVAGSWSIFASADCHPRNHCSFKEQGGPWPPHCILKTEGAKFHPTLLSNSLLAKFIKGWKQNEDSYSAFGGIIEMRNRIGFSLRFSLEEVLHKTEITELYIGGLATDYCVKATALDSVRLGFKTYLLQDACRAVNINPGDEVRALSEMANAGVEFVTTDEVIRGH